MVYLASSLFRDIIQKLQFFIFFLVLFLFLLYTGIQSKRITGFSSGCPKGERLRFLLLPVNSFFSARSTDNLQEKESYYGKCSKPYSKR